MKKDYKKGYTDGVNELKTKLISELKEILSEEKQTYSDGDKQDDVILGWIEALKMVLHTLDDK